MPILTAESGPLAGQSFSFGSRAVLGRGQIADVRLDDTTVSRRHCEIRASDDGWEVADLDSANGTRVNGETIAGSTALRAGDRVELGSLILLFTPAPESEQAALTSGFGDPGDRPALGALFQDVIARIKLFCELGSMAATAAPSGPQLNAALQAILHALPRLERVAVLLYASTADRFTPAGASVGKDPSSFRPAEVFSLAREALRHERGLVVTWQENPGRNEPEVRRDRAALPIRHAGETVGLLYLEGIPEASALRAGDRDTLYAVAALLGCLIDPQRHTEREVEIAGRDLALARRIQQRFLPQAPPAVPGYVILDSYTAARVIGGDHFDYLTLADGRLALVVADVSGKAVSGALYMARLGLLLKYCAQRAHDAASLLEQTNRLLFPELESGMFVTMLVLALDPARGELELATAGHPLPLCRDRHGVVTTLDVNAGAPLGAVANARYESTRAALAPGDCVLAYSDGLDEAHDKSQAQFGVERVTQVLQGTPDAQAAIMGLLAALGDFVGEEPQSDDLTLVALQRL